MKPISGVQPCDSSVVSSESQVQSTRSKMAWARSPIVLVLEILLAGEGSAKQHGGVDGRDFGVPHAFAGVDIGEVIEEAAMRGQLVP